MKHEVAEETLPIGSEHPERGRPGKIRRTGTQPGSARLEIQNNKIRENFEQSFQTFIKQFLLLNFVDANISLKNMVAKVEAELIRAALNLTNGHQVDAATYLGVKPTTLCEKIKKYDIKATKGGGIISNRDIFHMYIMELVPYISHKKD